MNPRFSHTVFKLFLLLVILQGITAPMARAQGQWDEQKLSERAQDPDFQYGPEPYKEPEEISKTPDFDFNWQWVLYPVIIIGLVALGYLILRNTLAKKNTSLLTESGGTPQNQDQFLQLNLPELIQESEARGDYRQAIRYRYWLTLRLLWEEGYIEWHPYKTDRQYLREIKNADRKEKLRHLIWVYELTWYGGMLPDKPQYQEYKAAFTPFNQPA